MTITQILTYCDEKNISVVDVIAMPELVCSLKFHIRTMLSHPLFLGKLCVPQSYRTKDGVRRVCIDAVQSSGYFRRFVIPSYRAHAKRFLSSKREESVNGHASN